MDEKLKLQKPTPNEFKKSKLPWNRPMLGKLDSKNEDGKNINYTTEDPIPPNRGPS